VTLIRDFLPEDVEGLRKMHARQGIDYAFPDLSDPLFFVKKVKVHEGRIVAAGVLKLCAETMLFLDPAGRPRNKMDAMRQLQTAVLEEARARGLDEIHAAVAEIGFDKRLAQLGWEKDRPGWHLWTRRTR
jgi:hypothetical protein